MFDFTFNVPTLFTAGAAIVGFIIWLVKLEAKANQTASDLEEAKQQHRADIEDAALKNSTLAAQVILHREQFQDYQLAAAKEFMTQSSVAEIRRDLIAEINRMEGRIEAQIRRLLPAGQQ
jgi:hypothetical protein